MSIELTDEMVAPAEKVAIDYDRLTEGDAIDLAWDVVKAAAPLVEAAVREQVAREIEADAAAVAAAAEAWRQSERHLVNSEAAARYDRVNAEAREAMAKHLRSVIIPRVRGEQS